MQYPTRFEDLPEYAFPRLKTLLAGIEPGGPKIPMSIGEPQHAIPDFVPGIMLEHAATLSKYPPNEGIPQLRQAITLLRGYGLQTWSFWQDFSQLQRLYPADWQTMVNNCKVLQAFGANNMNASNSVMTLTGFQTVGNPRSRLQ